MPATRFRKILVANRGEIACRVIATCRLLGIATVAVYSDVDMHALHVQHADEAVHIGPSTAAESYLNIRKIIDACKQTGADAVHPGYGFLSENSTFAKACKEHGIVFIGPSPESIAAIGDKISSKVLVAAKAPQVPLLPGYNGENQSVEILVKEAKKIGFPILLKASAGGGGKGMRIVRHENQLCEEIQAAQGESQRSFGDSRLLIEKYIETARHIEIQIFGDLYGATVAIYERECSVQRRHQKIIEECPSPFLTPELRKNMSASAEAIASLISYSGAGTVEFIVDGSTGKYYFLEVNTRLQVEHPVTEAVTGLDLVAMQIWVAQGSKLHDVLALYGGIQMKGHAIECRIYAEDPQNDFFPVTGKIRKFSLPSGPGIRSDTGVQDGSEITSFYDPLISKIVVHGETREEAMEKMGMVLRKCRLFGLTAHNVGFLARVLEVGGEFWSGVYDTGLIGRLMKKNQVEDSQRLISGVCVGAVWARVVTRVAKTHGLPFRYVKPGFRNVPYKQQTIEFQMPLSDSLFTVGYDIIEEAPRGTKKLRLKVTEQSAKKDAKAVVLWEGMVLLAASQLEKSKDSEMSGVMSLDIGGRRQSYTISQVDDKICINTDQWLGNFLNLTIVDSFKVSSISQNGKDGTLITPMPCRIICVNAPTGSIVKAGDTILTIESMKMETKIRAGVDGKVTVKVKEGDMVKAGETVAIIELQ
ncbi:alpha subunit of acetyl/propionyl-CoA carboxylase [Obelidium mucronatum]|nr:alpha subunit of acetyl/propionyl-CoA carboxylase [Obelidium mucronatum]